MPLFFSHTDRTFDEHIYGLKKVVYELLKCKSQSFWKYEELEKLCELLINYHDIAKTTPYFQYRICKAIVEENKPFFEKYKKDIVFWLNHSNIAELSNAEIKVLSRHTLFGATLSQQCFVNENLDIEQLLCFAILKAHHGDLSDFSSLHFTQTFTIPDKNNEFLEQIDSLKSSDCLTGLKSLSGFKLPSIEVLQKKLGKQRSINKLLEKIKKEKNVEYYLKTLYLYSLLLSADKGDVMLDNKDKILKRHIVSSDIIDIYKKNIPGGKEIDKLREDAYQTVITNLKKNFSSAFFNITLPTGLGKTFTAYKAALILKEKNPKHRIVYCLPYTSIIDQNGHILKKILKETNQSEFLATLHHYLSPPHERVSEKAEDILNYQEAEYLTEGWENEIIITTFVQLFESLFTNSNRALRKFHNLANSIIVLDEVQNIPPKYIEVIEAIFAKMADRFMTKFVFVTATQPVILKDKVVPLAIKTGKKESYYFDQLDRITIDQSLIKNGALSTEEIFADIKNTIVSNPDKSILVIVNTKAFSQNLFKYIKEITNKKCLYLSASLIPFHRNKIISDVKEAEVPIILISTQVVEAGVDIDFDIVYRELAPMDSINQAAGRCNRNGVKGKGLVKLFKRNKPSKIYDPTLMSQTAAVIDERSDKISEPEIYKLNRDYFLKIKKAAQDNSNVSADLLDHIYGLQFEQVKKSFRLIDDKNYNEYNYFISIDTRAEEIWNKYLKCFEIEKVFERKAAIKRIKPEILEYVVSIPDYIITPEENEKGHSIIKREDWRSFYDETIGAFNKENNSPSTHFL